ncbi:MAG: hypothetical protein ACREMB_22770 [Candidatus Rokuibacteriota bacterium]
MEPSHTALLIAIIAGGVITVLAFVYMTAVLREAIKTTRAVAGLVYREEEKTRALLRQTRG